MLYRRLVDSYERISETTRRTEMAGILVELLKETPPDLVHQIVYLTQGKLYPEFVPIEMRMAERLTLKAVAQASGSSEEGVSSSLASTGDLGGTAQDLLEKSEHIVEPRLQVDEVYRKLDEIARTSGTGSIARKIDLLVQLLSRATPIEAKYLIRTVTGKLRLGLADMTLLDALAIAYGGGKGSSADLERAYNLCSDLGQVATAVATDGLKAVRAFHLQPGKPIRPMLAQRMRSAEEVIDSSANLQPIPARVVDNDEALEQFFQEAIEAGCEGLVCKSLKPGSVYEAGNRGWNWIKYKREYVSEMTDTVDLVVVGALHGRGKRGGAYGALLLSVYDPETDSFPTVTKCGTGFTDRDLARLPGRLEPYRIDHPHPRVNARMKADVWFVPALVLEVLGAEITLSPIHTTDWGTVKPDTGLAVRFPRFTGRYRPDKAPEDATTDDEILQMYRSRLHKVRQ